MPILRLQGNKERMRGVYYEVDSDSTPIGIGGMGKVFRGRQVDEQTGATREVAIKFLFDDLTSEAIDKARREASIQLQNDNLVEMLGFIETQGQVILGQSTKHYHVVSELLYGVSLSDMMKGNTSDFEGHEVAYAAEMLKEFRNNRFEFARNIVHNILLGLMALHNAGYIHRDIDPTNIMLTSDRHVKLIDFGIAKKVRALTDVDVSKTKSGIFIGKAEYAAPELVLGDVAHQDQTTDIYAIGILLYQCITGFPPFQGDSKTTIADVLVMQQKKDVPLGPIKNKYLRAVIKKATQKKREKRYRSTAEMMVAMEQLPTPLEQEAFPYEWKKPVAAVAIVAALTGAAFGIRAFFLGGTSVIDMGSGTPSAAVVAKTPLEEANVLLQEAGTAQAGLRMLDSLSKAGNGEAKFLLSRLYFQPTGNAYIPVTIQQLKKNVSLHDDAKAHQLLEEAIKENGCSNFYAYFEYASDFRYGDGRSPEYKSLRDGEDRFALTAKEYFEKALKGAKESNEENPNELANSIFDKAKEELVHIVNFMSRKNGHHLMTEKERDEYIEWLNKQNG